MSIKSFPYNANHEQAWNNPAIQLFGNRLFKDQTEAEFLVEFLLVASSAKRLGEHGDLFTEALPSRELLAQMSDDRFNDTILYYAPKSRLNLKLFSFLASSRLENRHPTHREHHQELVESLKEHIRSYNEDTPDDVVHTLESILLGFQGVGGGRTWCAQSFLPLSRNLLAGESIWKDTLAKTNKPSTWADVIDSRYFDNTQHLIFAHGGELLYLQICLALSQSAETIVNWVEENDLNFSEEERSPERLYHALTQALEKIMVPKSSTFDQIVELIDSGLEQTTSIRTDQKNGQPRFVKAGWCPYDSWQEGYLFAVELVRLSRARLTILERISLLESACALHVLRSLGCQSGRYVAPNHIDWPHYYLAVTNPDEADPSLKRISRQCVKVMEKQLYNAVRCSPIDPPKHKSPRKKPPVEQADEEYAAKHFLALGKRMGLIVPLRGPGARLVLNEHLMRLLVFATTRAGERQTYDHFKHQVQAHYGLVFDAPGFTRASTWIDPDHYFYHADTIDTWLQEMIEAAGLLIHLSDACSLVTNPNGE